MCGENSVEHFMREYGVQNPLPGASNMHLPPEYLTILKYEARLPALLIGVCYVNWAGLTPSGKFFTKPLDGQILAVSFRSLLDFYI
jgi:hypothetical protein